MNDCEALRHALPGGTSAGEMDRTPLRFVEPFEHLRAHAFSKNVTQPPKALWLNVDNLLGRLCTEPPPRNGAPRLDSIKPFSLPLVVERER